MHTASYLWCQINLLKFKKWHISKALPEKVFRRVRAKVLASLQICSRSVFFFFFCFFFNAFMKYVTGNVKYLYLWSTTRPHWCKATEYSLNCICKFTVCHCGWHTQDISSVVKFHKCFKAELSYICRYCSEKITPNPFWHLCWQSFEVNSILPFLMDLFCILKDRKQTVLTYVYV